MGHENRDARHLRLSDLRRAVAFPVVPEVALDAHVRAVRQSLAAEGRLFSTEEVLEAAQRVWGRAADKHPK